MYETLAPSLSRILSSTLSPDERIPLTSEQGDTSRGVGHWFGVRDSLASYLSGFQYVVSMKGDPCCRIDIIGPSHLLECAGLGIVICVLLICPRSEPCKLPLTSRLSEEGWLSRLDNPTAGVRQAVVWTVVPLLNPLWHIPDERRRDRGAEGMGGIPLLW